MRWIHPQWYIILFLSSISGYYAKGQVQPLKFITYTTEDGLLHNYTKKCLEDKKGFIWIVSEIGLSQFDGVLFRNYQHDITDPASLPHNTINDLGIDELNRIWLALENGLCYYDPVADCFTQVDISNTFQSSPKVLALFVDQKRPVIWFMTDKALYWLNLEDFSIHVTSCQNASPSKINAMLQSQDDKLYVANYRKGFTVYDINLDKAENFLPASWVMTFYEDPDHRIWIGSWTAEQLISWSSSNHYQKGWVERNAKDELINMIVTGITRSPFFGDSMLLLSTLHMGVRIFDIRKQAFISGINRDIFLKYSLPTDFINYIFTDSRNILWLCTWEGLCKVNIQEQQFRSVEIPFLRTPNFQYYNLVEGIVQTSPGIWWLGVDGCGIIEYDTANQQLLSQHFADLKEPNLYKPSIWTEFLTLSEDSTIWSFNATGFASIKDGIEKQYEIQIPAFYRWRKTVCVAPDNSFWVTAGSHLVHFDPKTKSYTSFVIDSALIGPFSAGIVAESAFGSDGNLWTGTVLGLYQFDTHRNISNRIPIPGVFADSANVKTIHSLIAAGQDTIYLGTMAGLGIYNIRTRHFELKGENEVYPILGKSLLQDREGKIWIYTPHALYRYDPAEDEFSKFTTADGIYNFSSDQTHLFSFHHNFYIGYRGVYTEFDPLKVNVNQVMVKPLITDIVVNTISEKIDPDNFNTTYYSLPLGYNDISFHFTGIDFTNSNRITFRYKMKATDDWHEIGTNRSVTYTNLSPGHYSFQLQARNSSGILSDQQAKFNFFIPPTMIQRWWFWPLSGILFVLMVILLAQKQIMKIRKEEKLKTETNKMLAQLETKLLRSQMNPHFIFNSLNSIQKYIWENKEEDAAEYLAQFAKLIRAILENSRKEFISLKEEVDVLKLYIGLEHRRSNGKFDYHIRIDEHLPLTAIQIPPLLLQPYIENAIWHGVNKKSGQGHIDINMQTEDGLLKIEIDDDGVGRSANEKIHVLNNAAKESLGTTITEQRIKQLQNKTSIAGVEIVDKMKDGLPAGTKVIITIPVNAVVHA